MVTNFQ